MYCPILNQGNKNNGEFKHMEALPYIYNGLMSGDPKGREKMLIDR